MKVCLGQINTTPGDFDGNQARIVRGIEMAVQEGADVVLFPELCIPGYLSQDLMYHPDYVGCNDDVINDLCELTGTLSTELHVVVGHIQHNRGPGKPFFNAASVIGYGKVLGTYHKHLLPFYDVFDELRYFQPGRELLTIEIAGERVGIAICEDLWNDKDSDDYNYLTNPLARYRNAGVDVILSLNASPYVHDKSWDRIRTIAPGTDDLSVVYVNQYGGQDELVFDGQSFVLTNRDLIHRSSEVKEDSFAVVDLKTATPLVRQVANDDHRAAILKSGVSLYELLVVCLQDYVRKSGFSELVLASSGGVDSALVCALACDAVGSEHVHAIRLPSVFSSDHSRVDAIQLHENLGCWDYELPVAHESFVDRFNEHFNVHTTSLSNLVTRTFNEQQYGSVADENIQARIRDLAVMHFSNAFGAMPLSTGNKTESACGYYTHFDMNFSFAPIKDLYKHQVFELARVHPSIPDSIWRKPPSAELAPGQTDETSLLPYAVLDPIVQAHIEEYISSFDAFSSWVQQCNEDNQVISSELNVLQAWCAEPPSHVDYERIVSLIGRMEYKRRQTCPGTKVSKVAFGIGRRLPIVEKWS